MPHLVMLRCIV